VSNQIGLDDAQALKVREARRRFSLDQVRRVPISRNVSAASRLMNSTINRQTDWFSIAPEVKAQPSLLRT
jgi:hypothetical protein